MGNEELMVMKKAFKDNPKTGMPGKKLVNVLNRAFPYCGCPAL